MDDPSNQTLYVLIEDVKERLGHFYETNAEEHARIETEVKKTNGTVADLNRWRWMFAGGLVVVMALVVPLFVSFMKSYLSH